MLSSVSVRAEGHRRGRRLVAPASLIRPDRARAIDRIIDYFGGGRPRGLSAPPFAARPVSGRDGPPTLGTTRP